MSEQGASLEGARLLVRELVHAGIGAVCISPGSRSTPLALAFAEYEQEGVQIYSHLDERSSAFFALGLARATGLPVALVCTSGTAAAHYFPAIIEASQSGIPLVVLSADRPPELRDCGANQTIDQNRLFGGYVRFFADTGLPIADAAGGLHLRRLACRAVAEACGPAPGPVHLNCPFREPLSPGAAAAEPPAPESAMLATAERARLSFVPQTQVVLPAAELAPLVARLKRAERPLLIAGPMPPDGGIRGGAIARLAAALGAPLLAEPTANLRGAGIAEFSVDAYDAILRAGDPEPGRTSAEVSADNSAAMSGLAPDLIVRLGASPTSKALGGLLARWRTIPQIVICAPGKWPDPAASAAVVVRAEIAPVVDALAGALGGPPARPAWRAAWVEAGRRTRVALDRHLDVAPVFEGTVVRAISRSLPPDGVLFVGNSLAVRALDLFWPDSRSDTEIHVNRGASGIDGLVSTTLGIAAGHDGPTLGLLGDVSFLHDIGGLLAVRRAGARAIFVILDNDGGGIFDHLPVATEGHACFDPLFTTPHGLDLAALAAAYGVSARTLVIEELPAALKSAFARQGTTVLVVKIDRKASLEAHRLAIMAAAGAEPWN